MCKNLKHLQKQSHHHIQYANTETQVATVVQQCIIWVELLMDMITLGIVMSKKFGISAVYADTKDTSHFVYINN